MFRNANQESLGKIDDLAIDQNTGEVRYVVLSFGGTMGIGGKLLPVPWIVLKTIAKPAVTEGVTPEIYCVLNVDKDVLQKCAHPCERPVDELQQPELGGCDRHFLSPVHCAATCRRHDDALGREVTCVS